MHTLSLFIGSEHRYYGVDNNSVNWDRPLLVDIHAFKQPLGFREIKFGAYYSSMGNNHRLIQKLRALYIIDDKTDN